MLALIPEPKMGSHGHIQKWAKDYAEAEPSHRHISQLFTLHPGIQITFLWGCP
jgi:alpha-L-fucosidase 2